MTSSKIQRIKLFLFLLIFLLAQSARCDFRASRETLESTSNKKSALDGLSKKGPTGKIATAEGNKTLEESKTIDTNKTVHTTEPQKKHSMEGHVTPLNAGALKRGFYVFLGLSVLVMAYIVFRSFRLSKTRAQMVRKYGVLTHRQDVEMRPLPLEEEDDEDTTVFDATNVLSNDTQHQNL